MDTNRNPSNEREGWQHQGESLNTGSTNAHENEQHDSPDQPGSKRKVGALQAASVGRSATEQVNPHSNSGLANTGTNISYEGPTAPGAGGSVGTGYASGKSAVDPTISTSSDEDGALSRRPANDGDEQTDRP
jgi:hypothetical protein